jgi:hypothetical protein
MNMKMIWPMTAWIFLLYACAPALSPYTQQLHEKYDWKESDLKKVQFYLTDDIVLRRRVDQGQAEIKGGEIKIMNGSRYEVVRFRKNTPGILSFIPKDNRLAISFEEGSDKYLIFGPNPKMNNQYKLLAANWTRQEGEVTYMGKKWETTAASALAGLGIQLKNLSTYDAETRIAKGRTVR